MNIKVFNIRLSIEHCEEDQNKMNDFLNSVEIKLTSTNFVTTSTQDFWSAVVFYVPKKNTKSTVDYNELTVEEKNIYYALKQWRSDSAKESNWSAFMICHNSHLISIAKSKPQTIEELSKIKNFGNSKAEKYGNEIISILNASSVCNNLSEK